MSWPQPPYTGDAWEYAAFPTLPDGWQLVAQYETSVFAKRQTQKRQPIAPQPSWNLSYEFVDGKVIRRLRVWE